MGTIWVIGLWLGIRVLQYQKKARPTQLWQLIGQDIFTNDSSLAGSGLSQSSGHPEWRAESTANPKVCSRGRSTVLKKHYQHWTLLPTYQSAILAFFILITQDHGSCGMPLTTKFSINWIRSFHCRITVKIALSIHSQMAMITCGQKPPEEMNHRLISIWLHES